MYVIIKTDNEQRGGDSIVEVVGPYETSEAAQAVCRVLDQMVERHDGYCTADYTVVRVGDSTTLMGDTMRVA